MEVKELITVNFEGVIKTQRLVIIDFYADWCGPCKMLSPIIVNMAKEFPNINFYKVNVDRESTLARKMNIQSIPTVMFYKQGHLVNQFSGYRNPQEIKQIISQFSK